MESRQAPAPIELLVELRDVVKIHRDGAVRALDGVSLKIPAGQSLSIVGPSGCGKSTLLNMIGALDAPTSGEIRFRGVPLTAIRDPDRLRAREIGFVFQTFYLLPNLTARENVQMPMFGDGRSDTARVERAETLLALVGLADRAGHLPSQLSIGQRQRVAIARALANEPALILADEPTGNLDSANSLRLWQQLGELASTQTVTDIMVTHEPAAAAHCQRVFVLGDGLLKGEFEVTDRDPAGVASRYQQLGR